jgi:anti-sigma B factor antagonist
MADDAEQLSIVVEQQQDNRMLIRLQGELDVLTAPLLAEKLNEANSEIVVDLADLAFLDARGLGTLASASARAERHGDHLVVINPDPLMERMFKITGLDHLLSASDLL